jgi:hypothetical protein
MDWEYALGRVSGQASNSKAAFQVVTSTELNAQYTDPTLMATRMISGVCFAASATQSVVVIGLIAWDDINDTIPQMSELPGPLTNGNLDWIIRQVAVNACGDAGNFNVVPGDESVTSRARRRLGSSRTILCVVETGDGAVTTASVVDVRCLIKE